MHKKTAKSREVEDVTGLNTIDLMDVFNFFWRYKITVVGSTLFFFLAGLAYVQTTPTYYHSTIKIERNNNSDRVEYYNFNRKFEELSRLHFQATQPSPNDEQSQASVDVLLDAPFTSQNFIDFYIGKLKAPEYWMAEIQAELPMDQSEFQNEEDFKEALFKVAQEVQIEMEEDDAWNVYFKTTNPQGWKTVLSNVHQKATEETRKELFSAVDDFLGRTESESITFISDSNEELLNQSTLYFEKTIRKMNFR